MCLIRHVSMLTAMVICSQSGFGFDQMGMHSGLQTDMPWQYAKDAAVYAGL